MHSDLIHLPLHSAVYMGDAFTLLKRMQPESVQLLLSDPPRYTARYDTKAELQGLRNHGPAPQTWSMSRLPSENERCLHAQEQSGQQREVEETRPREEESSAEGQHRLRRASKGDEAKARRSGEAGCPTPNTRAAREESTIPIDVSTSRGCSSQDLRQGCGGSRHQQRNTSAADHLRGLRTGARSRGRRKNADSSRPFCWIRQGQLLERSVGLHYMRRRS